MINKLSRMRIKEKNLIIKQKRKSGISHNFRKKQIKKENNKNKKYDV